MYMHVCVNVHVRMYADLTTSDSISTSAISASVVPAGGRKGRRERHITSYNPFPQNSTHLSCFFALYSSGSAEAQAKLFSLLSTWTVQPLHEVISTHRIALGELYIPIKQIRKLKWKYKD